MKLSSLTFKVTEVPWLPMAGITLFGHVFVRNAASAVTVEHEAVHVAQQRAHPLWFWLSYVLLLPLGWNPWRVRWEAEAYCVEARAGVPVDDLAAMLAGGLYLWPCRKATAKAAILAALAEVPA